MFFRIGPFFFCFAVGLLVGITCESRGKEQLNYTNCEILMLLLEIAPCRSVYLILILLGQNVHTHRNNPSKGIQADIK
jgi:hypothetical protein